MTRVCGLTSIALTILTLTGCLDAADDAAPALAERRLAAGPRRRAPRPRVLRPRRPTRLGLSITRLPSSAAQAAPVASLAIDVTGPLPARGLDPVLHVGDRELRDYVYVQPDVLRFVTDQVPPGAAVTLSYGAEGVVLRAGDGDAP